MYLKYNTFLGILWIMGDATNITFISVSETKKNITAGELKICKLSDIRIKLSYWLICVSFKIVDCTSY